MSRLTDISMATLVAMVEHEHSPPRLGACVCVRPAGEEITFRYGPRGELVSVGVHPATAKALARRGLIRLIPAEGTVLGWRAAPTREGRALARGQAFTVEREPTQLERELDAAAEAAEAAW